MNWKTIFIIGLGILSITVLYYCYKRYYKEEGFQVTQANIISSDTFVGSSVAARQYRFDGSIISLRQMYTEIINFVTDYHNFSGYANANLYNYYSNKYKKNLTIVDFPYSNYATTGTKYWFPFTGQYGASPNWLTNFAAENTAVLDLDVYNNNLSNYITFVNTYSGNNKQKFIFNRPLTRPSLLYRGFDLTQPPSNYNLLSNDGSILDINITQVAGFDESHQSWWRNFAGTGGYARANQDLYPPSDNSTDTLYHVLYNNPKPPNLTYSNVNNGKKAGQIVNLIPDRRSDLEYAKTEKLQLNVYGGQITQEQSNDFKESMFLGSVFTNFDDQYNLDTILRVPYNGIINGSNCHYSFNMFLPELTPTVVIAGTSVSFKYQKNQPNITYNTNLVNLRNNNTIKLLSDIDLNVDSNTFIANVNTVFPSRPFAGITNSNQAFVGQITPQMMAKIPNLAHRYITSWVYNRSTRYLGMHLEDLSGSSGINANELKKAQYICLAMINFSGESLNNFISNYANYGSFTPISGVFTVDQTMTNVPNEEVAKRIVASSRIYNSYQYNPTTSNLSLSISKTVGNVFNKGSTSNYFRNPDTSHNIAQYILSALLQVNDSISQELLSFPTDGATNALANVNAANLDLTPDISTASFGTAATSTQYVKSILQNIASSLASLNIYLRNGNSYDQALSLVNYLVNIVGDNPPTLPSNKNIQGIVYNSATNTNDITITLDNTTGYVANNYISINGTTNYNGDFFKIISVLGNTLIVDNNINIGQATAGGTISISSLYKFLKDSQTNINASLAVITNLSNTIKANENIKLAEKNLNINKAFVDSVITNFLQIKNTIKCISNGVNIINNISQLLKTPPTGTGTDTSVKNDISGAITDVSGAITNTTTFITDITLIKTNSISGDSIFNEYLRIRNLPTNTPIENSIAQQNIDNYLNTLPQYNEAITLLAIKNALTNLKTSLTNLQNGIGSGTIAAAMAAPTDIEIQTLVSDFNNLTYNNKLLPDYGNLKQLNINSQEFLNSIAQLYYESSDGLYEMTTIYDVYMVGSNMVDIRFDKKQRLPNGRINNLEIQYIPQIQEYNRLLDIMNDGSWSNYYSDRDYTKNGQTLTSNAIDFYYDDLSAVSNKLEPIFNPVYPIDQNINVKDLQIQLSNLNSSNDIITNILNGKLTGSRAPYIPETQDTLGMNYTDRLATIQNNLYNQMNTIQTQISGILQGCARVFVTPTNTNNKWTFPINGMAIGVNAALTYNLAYNGNLEIDMGNTQGNIGQYYPTIIYTKNLTPPIICGDIKFINKAAALFNQTAFLNLSSMTTQITGDDNDKRRTSEPNDVYTRNVGARQNNFYDSNDGPLYVDKILGFQQVNSNTCYYKWQETQYDPLTNGVFSTAAGVIKQRTVNVQYQFMYDNTEYQNPKLLPDNNPNGLRVDQGFKYLAANTYVPFGDLYQSLYTWYASATRDLFSYLNDISNQYTRLYTSEYTTLMGLYNTNTSNISTLNISTTMLFSTNLTIATAFTQMLPTLSITTIGTGACDSIFNKPPTFTSNYESLIYNFRPGDGYGLTTYSGITYNKYRTIDIGYFMSNMLLANGITTAGPIPPCDPIEAISNPENCFTAEVDKCLYNLGTNSATYSNIIMSNLDKRTSIKTAITATNTAITGTTNAINAALATETTNYLRSNIIYSAGQTLEELYPQVSNINNQITSLSIQSNDTRRSIDNITTQYNTILTTQNSDINLPTYMNNQVIPIIKPLPDEAASLDNQYGQCPPYLCTSPVVMNTLVEQYNLDNDYDDTITRVLKGATPNSYQCDYLVEVRKKNAIVINNSLQFDRIRFTPLQVPYNDNRDGIYFNGSNSYIRLGSSDPCFTLGSNNFTIDWFQYGIFDSDNLISTVFVVGNYRLGVTFEQRTNNILRFNLYINSSIIKYIDFNYNEFNRWTYLAIVRYNNVITCYKDGFAFLSFEQQGDITGDITNIYIGNDSSGNYFKGCMRNFSFNNYDALYQANIFNTVPTTPVKNINTKFILQMSDTGTINNIISRTISNLNVNNNGTAPSQITATAQTFLTNGTILTEIFRGNNQNNGVAVSDAGVIYLADTANHVIKQLNSDGTFTIIAGRLGVQGSLGINGLATSAYLNSPSSLVYGNSTLFIADTGNNRICYKGDNNINELVTGVTNVKYITYYNGFIYYVFNNNIYRININTGSIETIVNTGLNNPSGICIDSTGNLYIADSGNHRICKLVGSTLTPIVGITGVATTTDATNLGDGGIASLATLKNPTGVTIDSSGNLYIADTGNNRVRIVTYYNSQYTTITTIAGDGTPSSSYNQGYGRFIPIIPQSVFYKTAILYVVDSRRICSVKKATIPSAPSSRVYQFNSVTSSNYITVGTLGEPDYKFNKNIFTIQWFMYMVSGVNQTIFTFENGDRIQLGVTFEGSNMKLWVNETSYTIPFINNEIQSLWVHLGLVNNGSTLSFYKNSILIFSIDSTNISFNTVDTQLTIGNRNTKDLSNNFKGYIYNFIIYNKVAINYNTPYSSPPLCSPNLVLYLANGTTSFNDSSISNPEISQNFVSYIDLFPYANTYNAFKINLHYNNNTQQEIPFNTVYRYGEPLSVNLGTLYNIISFNIYSLQDTKAIQQWLLEGSSNGTNWITLHQQLEPYRTSTSPIYPKKTSYSSDIPIQVQQNTGGDYLTMTKSFKVATLIADCSIVITSNVDNQDNYTKGVTSSNGFFIQENTPYVVDSSGSDVSGFQFIGNLLSDYESNIKSLYDPITSNANTIYGKMSVAYQNSLSDTYSAVGKLNTLNFYSTQFNNYDSLRTYMLNNTRFRNTIFDSYPYSNAYMSNILRFNIADSNTIDIVFNKVDLTGTATSINYGTTTTAGARYRLSVSQGFLDLTASFVSDVTPTANILNDDYTTVSNPRGKDYKDRLNQTSKLVSGIRTPISDASITQYTLPTVLTTIESLTGLTGITFSNIVDATKNKIEYMVTTDGTSRDKTLPIGKTNYIVQYVSPTEVNSLISATIENTKFKTTITVANINSYITNFKAYFNDLYSTTKGYPFNSILKKVYSYSIVNNILYLSVGIEYTKSDNTIYYNIIPNISEFGTQVYYKVIFTTGNNVLAFEPCVSTAGGTLTSYTDTTPLQQSGTTPTEIINNYKNNLLWKQIKFIPSSASSTSTYSISQIQFFNSALLSDEATKPRVIQSLSINGGNTNNFDLIQLVDGVNTTLRSKENISGRYFTHTYVGGEITATFKEPTSANGFSFMTAYSLQNPQKWVVQGTTDGTTWIDLVRQDTNYLDTLGVNAASIYNSFYRTPIFSFSAAPNVILDQPLIRTTDTSATTNYQYLRITPLSGSFNYQLTQITLYNGQTLTALATTPTTPATTTADPTVPTRNLSYLFDNRNISYTDPRSVKTLEAPTNTPLTIQFSSVIKFNGISFVTGIDVNKCMTRWIIEASTDNINYNTIHRQEFPYTNDSIHYPHFFCRTPIFYSDGQTIETSQPQLYETKSWPIRYVRFKPIYMYGAGRGGTFEVSHIDFFNDATRLSASSSTNDNLLTEVTSSTTIDQLNTFVGNYFDPSTNHIDFDFGLGSPQSFNGFSFMSGPQANNCVQLWTLEVSIDNSFWVIVHSTNNTPYSNNFYPSRYYRLPIIYFDKNINIESPTKYYIISGTPTATDNSGMLIEIKILFTIVSQYIVTSFISTDYNNDYYGKLYSNTTQNVANYLKWNNFLTAPISSSQNLVYYRNVYPTTTTGPTQLSSNLYSIGTSAQLVIGMLNGTPTGLSPPIYGVNNRGTNNITRFNIYINTTTNNGAVFNTNSSINLDQLNSWVPPIASSQGFTNYTKIDYIETFLLQTNKSFDIKLFRFITSNNKFLSKMFYSVESQNKNFIIRLKAYVEIIGYTIRTGLYSQVSDPDSWKLFGIKNGSYVLLDKQDNYDIPVERSSNLPPFYFGSKATTKNIIKDIQDEKKPNMEIIELYYKQKINPFGKAVFKQYMYDNDKTYYMVFDEYDNNRNLIGEDLIIGFVIVKGKVKKPIMYENPDGSFDAFNLKRKEMIAFWKKKILIHGLKLETKYLSDY